MMYLKETDHGSLQKYAERIITFNNNKCATKEPMLDNIYVYDIASRKRTAIIDDRPDSALSSEAISPDGVYIAIRKTDKIVRIHDTYSGDIIGSFTTPADTCLCMFSRDSNYLYLRDDTTIYIYETINKYNIKLYKTIESNITKKNCSLLEYIAVSPDNKHIVCTDDFGNIEKFNIEAHTSVILHGLNDKLVAIRPRNIIVFSPNGQYIANNESTTNTITIWDTASNRTVKTLKLHDKLVGKSYLAYITFSPDSKYIISGDYRISFIFDIETATIINRIPGAGSVFVSYDHRHVIMKADERSLRILTIVPNIWKPHLHTYFHASFKSAVESIYILRKRIELGIIEENKETILLFLPIEIWHIIISFFNPPDYSYFTSIDTSIGYIDLEF